MQRGTFLRKNSELSTELHKLDATQLPLNTRNPALKAVGRREKSESEKKKSQCGTSVL